MSNHGFDDLMNRQPTNVFGSRDEHRTTVVVEKRRRTADLGRAEDHPFV